jgi:hypothetical protein
MDCGHYRTCGAAAHLAFNLHNTAAQCVYCNRDRDGAQKAFEQGLIERIGAEKVEAINNDNSVRRFDIPYLQRIKSIFTRKARALETPGPPTGGRMNHADFLDTRQKALSAPACRQ